MFGQRILVLVPHPDDEVGGAAIAIRRVVAEGATVILLDLTHGRPPQESQWPWNRGDIYRLRVEQRRSEAAAAARALGVQRIADDGLPARRLRHILPVTSSRVFAALDAHDIDTIWAPAYDGAHPDHAATNAIAAALARARPDLSVWEFAEYNNAGGRKQANAFPDNRGYEIELAATPEEARWKSAVLGLYRSEAFNRGNVADGGPPKESFRPLPRHDYARPPHAGRLFYERFHWVPFRMPWIDSTRGAEVSAAIVTFLAAGTRG